jgi:hypothetical protein
MGMHEARVMQCNCPSIITVCLSIEMLDEGVVLTWLKIAGDPCMKS